MNHSTHRERKEGYIKSLETEVLTRRTTEARLLTEQRRLNAEIARLKGILDQFGISYDDKLDANVPSIPASEFADTTSSVGVTESSFHTQQLHVNLGSGSGSEFLFGSASDSSEASPQSKLKAKRSFFRSRGRSDADERPQGKSAWPPLSAHCAVVLYLYALCS